MDGDGGRLFRHKIMIDMSSTIIRPGTFCKGLLLCIPRAISFIIMFSRIICLARFFCSRCPGGSVGQRGLRGCIKTVHL